MVAFTGKAIQNCQVRSRLIVAHLGNVESPDLVSQVADFLLTYDGMLRSLCTGRYRGKLYVSLRMATQHAKAGEILRACFPEKGQAGGHDVIAGGSLRLGEKASQQEWKAQEDSIVNLLVKRLRLPKRSEFKPVF